MCECVYVSARERQKCVSLCGAHFAQITIGLVYVWCAPLVRVGLHAWLDLQPHAWCVISWRGALEAYCPLLNIYHSTREEDNHTFIFVLSYSPTKNRWSSLTSLFNFHLWHEIEIWWWDFLCSPCLESITCFFEVILMWIRQWMCGGGGVYFACILCAFICF